ncbi:T9SS type A sorting domain-containing protein [Flavobacterium sp. 2]|uniref:T9SS type A sorting domain-containing protein n=1 Tax=Flavobacterium sp. 2 TaxID=308053 RepID=UPI000C173CE8|nr:T9SS type A sorting domain-containing protein [Flavobacterium sp. 2]PIF59779.1 putative secreted protein (Por secretion system target) [Flavobacterium sp. 2]
MRQNYIYLVLAFILSISMFGQKVTLTPTLVNGAGFDGSSINLGGTPYSSISLGVKVEMPTIPGNNGTLTIYVVSGLNPTVAIGGSSTPLFFGESKIASQSFIININWNSISELGGQIYAEYKTSSNIAYKSGYIKVTKNPTMNNSGVIPPADAPNPTKIPNTLCCNQTVRLGDKPAPITGSQYLNPYQDQPYGINSSWASNGNVSARFQSLDNINKVLYMDYVTEPGNFTVTRSLGYNYSKDKPNKSNTVTITVVPSPITRNSIYTNDILNSEGFIELSNLKKLLISGEDSKVNLKVLQDPFYVIQQRDPGTNVDSYKWEYTTTHPTTQRNWTTIPNENSANLNFSDPSQFSNFEDTYYFIRRIAIYQNITQVSNEIKVLVRALRYNNTICCDQILKIQTPTNFENPQIITGSTINIDTPLEEGINFTIHSITYQWQSQNIEANYTASSWYNIPGATSKDYLPSQSLIVASDRRGSYNFQLSYKYRRILYINYSVINNRVVNNTVKSYSNEASLNGTTSQPYIQLYPNPASSILNIESAIDISNAKLTISNIMGTVVNMNNYTAVNPKLISIDVSNFPTGTYFITIENQSLGTVQRTFVKQ